MAFKFICGVCGQKLGADEDLFGETIKCPACGNSITVPEFKDFQNVEASSTDNPSHRTDKLTCPGKKSGIEHITPLRQSIAPKKQNKKSALPLLLSLLVILAGGGIIVFLLLQNRSGLRKAKPELELPETRGQSRTLDAALPESKSPDSAPVLPRYHYIRLEAEKAGVIEPSFEIDADNECSGNQYLVIREDCGSGWTSPPSGSGKAEYTFNIPSSGDYYLWARVKWESGCSDAFFVYIDNINDANGVIKPRNRKGFVQGGDQNTLGKDTTFHTWHWYCRHVFSLNKGEHKLTVKNQDDGSMADMFLLTDNPDYVPCGREKWIADIDSINWADAGGAINFDSRRWKIKEDADSGRTLLKTSTESFPVLLSSVNTVQPYYLSFIAENCSDFRIIFDYQDKDNYSSIEKTGAGLCLKAVKNGREEISHEGAFPVSGIEPQKYFIELFREENKAGLVINDGLVLREKIDAPINGKIAFDINNGAFIKDVKIGPLELERIHTGCCHYAEFQQHPFHIVDGSWRVASGGFSPGAKTGLAILGDSSWRNYQASCMIQVPGNGAAGIGLYYRDKNNYYLVRLKKDREELLCVKDGMEKILASKAVEMDTKDFKRITLNIYENTIQVFYDGENLFQSGDDTFFSGKFFLMAKDADNFRVDDLEIWSIEHEDSAGSNERLAFFSSPPSGVRVINSVIDAFGATGGFHPGDYADERKETELQEIMSVISGKTISTPAEVLDFQWLTFDADSFREHQGSGKEPGFIIAQSFNPDEKKYLWSTENLFGDWEFSFHALGKCGRLGVLLHETGGGTAGAGKYPFTINIPEGALEKEKYLDIRERPAPQVWNDEEWHKLAVRKSGEILSFHLDENELGVYRAASKNIILRPAVFYENGTVFFDNLICRLYPDLFYDFEYNQPWSLAMSDWKPDCDGKIKHGGGYYSYVILNNGEKPAALYSKRKFKGDFMLSVIIDLDDVEKFALNLEDPEKISAPERFELTRDQISCFSGEKRIASGNLKNFSTEERRLTTAQLRLVNGYACIYVNDELGSQRLAMTQPVSYPKDKPFKVKISGFPKLKMSKIMIWGRKRENDLQ